MNRLLKHAAFLLPFAFVLGACGDGTGADTTRVSVMMTDAPGEVAAAWVAIDRVYLQPGPEEFDGEGDMDGDGHDRVDLVTDDITLNLITLANDIEELAVDVPVTSGFYHQLRIVVPEACIAVETEDEGVYDYYATPGFDETLVPEEDLGMAAPCDGADHLQTPSLPQSGIKVQLPGDGDGVQITGEQYILLVDFDAAESFGHVAGQGDKWVMHPVIRGGELELSSSITANLVAADGLEFPDIATDQPMTLGDFVADVDSEEEDVPFTDPDEDDVYTATFSAMLPGVTGLIVSVEGPDGWNYTFDPVSATVDLTSGQNVVVDFTLTEITASP